MKFHYGPLPFALVLSASACQSAPEFSIPEPAYSTSVIHAQFAFASQRLIFVLVADDANTSEAAELRARLPHALRNRLVHEVRSQWTTCGNGDPGQWHPGDARVVIARPSASDAEALLTWVDVPDLAWITNTSKEEDVDAIIAATAVALETRLAKPGESYRPLRVTKRAIDLITGARSAENAAESNFMATLPPWAQLDVIVANTRDDEDVSPVEDFVPIRSIDEPSFYPKISVIGPSTLGNVFCNVSPLGDSRLERWADEVDPRFISWPCTNQDTWDHLMGTLLASCGSTCYGGAPAVSPDGSAQCRAFIDQPDLTSCNPARGWSDPGGVATFVTQWGMNLRHCEIAQHTGEKLVACRHSLECLDCGGGFCMTEVPGLITPDSFCADGKGWSLRFTGGSIAAWVGLLHVYCDTGVH